jgi:ABC-type branched-subunit amino acid transport system ATPase component
VISRLEGLGLQRQSIPLPKCVVLGEQSSGKSSVIEAISGVRTPRASGTCTRCPL